MFSTRSLFLTLPFVAAALAGDLVAPGDLPNYVSMTQQLCSSTSLVFDFDTNKCFSPAKHPSKWNCAFLLEDYNEDTQECCAPSTPAPDCLGGHNLLWDPSTTHCYNPAKHPSVQNCYIYGLDYNSEAKECCKPDNTPVTPSCTNGELPVVDSNGACTGTCATCGWCQAYNSLGQPACNTSGDCTLICPSGLTVHSKWGLLYCA